MNACTDASYNAADRAEYYLSLWLDWMRQDDPGLGYPAKVPVLLCQGAYWDSDEQLARLDHAAAMATDAVILGLQPYLRIAIRNAYEQGKSAKRGPVIDEAHRMLMVGLHRRGFY